MKLTAYADLYIIYYKFNKLSNNKEAVWRQRKLQSDL